ncbi:MAG: LLM class flavin-dependent oxidoreductase [Ornithinimicrobium sp.]
MRYGVCILPEYPWGQAEPIWRRAEELGFDHAWTYDHLVWAGLPDAPWHSTVATLTAAAMVTERIRLGTLVASPNFRHPVTFMRDAVTLDDISSGRLLLGMGTGADRDAEILGEELTRGQRTRRFAEFVELLDALLRGDHVDYTGDFFTAADARNQPGPTQLPRTPFVIAANGPRAMALAARYGQGWLTTGPLSGPVGRTAAQGDAESLAQWWEGLAQTVDRFDAIEAAARQSSDVASTALDRYLSLDACGVMALSSADFFAEQAKRAADLGFTDVVVHWPRASPPYEADLAVLDQIDLRA